MEQRVLTIPGVRRLWIAQLVSIAGDFLAIFAVLSVATFRMHATAAGITGITISYILPLAIFGPLAGVLVDRRDPRRTMIATDLIRAVLAIALLFSRNLIEIYATLFSLSTVSTFFIPAQSIAIRTLVPRESLRSVNALMQQSMLLIRMASPAAAGVLILRLGPASCFLLDAVSFLFSALILSRIALVHPATSHSAVRTVLADLFAGVRFLLHHSSLSFVMTAMAAATFAISCFSPLLALYVRDILHTGVHLFAGISAAIGFGMIAGTETARHLAIDARHAVLAGLTILASGITLMGAVAAAPTALLGAFFMGAGVGLLTVPAQTLIQSETPVPMAGRVTSAVMSLISAAQILGLLLSGVSASAVGLRPMFFASAGVLACLILAGVWKCHKTYATPCSRSRPPAPIPIR